MEITLAVILSYVSNYLLSFVISLLGAFTNEMMTTMRTKQKITMFRILAPGFFDSFLVCALQSHFKMDFAVYAFLCFLLGMWGLQIIETVSNQKFVFLFLRSILKSSSSAIAKAAGESLEDIKKEETKNNETGDSSEEETTQDDVKNKCD